MKVRNAGSNMTELSLTDGTVVFFSYKWLEGRTAQDAYQTFFDDLVRGV